MRNPTAPRDTAKTPSMSCYTLTPSELTDLSAPWERRLASSAATEPSKDTAVQGSNPSMDPSRPHDRGWEQPTEDGTVTPTSTKAAPLLSPTSKLFGLISYTQ